MPLRLSTSLLAKIVTPHHLVAVLVLSISCYQMIILNFFKYDDDGYIYVYAHTRRETLDMLEQIEKSSQTKRHWLRDWDHDRVA